MPGLALAAQEETSYQFWGSVILGHQKNDHLYMEVEIQPKTQFSGKERWRNIDATWAVAYDKSKWFGLTGELVTGYTEQINDVSSLELTPRAGVRLYLAEQIFKPFANRQARPPEGLPLERFSLAAWLRMEYRNFYYFGDLESSSEWRFRLRPELKVAFNNNSLNDDGTFYGRTDVELFVPLSEDVPERFVESIRFRIGPGYRINSNYRVELMFMLDGTRKSPLVDFEEDVYMLDLRLTLLF